MAKGYGDLSTRGVVCGDDGVRAVRADRAWASGGDADGSELLPLIHGRESLLRPHGNGFSRWRW
jgi:hypothetical protein